MQRGRLRRSTPASSRKMVGADSIIFQKGVLMTAKKKEEKTTDEIQNGGRGTIEERLTALEDRLNLVVRCNCLLETERDKTHG